MVISGVWGKEHVSSGWLNHETWSPTQHNQC